jgi:hypothetical protein
LQRKSRPMPKVENQSLWDAICEALKHALSLAFVFLATTLLSISSPWGFFQVKAHEVASLVFPVAGTIVALALTAAGLASTFIGRLSDQMPDIYAPHPEFTAEARARAVLHRAEALRKGIFPGWRGSVFVLCSFLLSAVALIMPADPVPLGKGFNLAVDSVFSVSALACLIVGSLWFLPTVRFSFRGELLQQLIRSAEQWRNSTVPTVAEIFRRAELLRKQNSPASYKQIQAELCKEYAGRPFPSVNNIAIDEAEGRAPVEESTAGLPIIKRGIDSKDWSSICEGVVLTLEQIEQYEHEHGSQGSNDAWHDRLHGIERATETGISKWLPESFKIPPQH